MAKTKQKIILLIISLAVYSCANQLPPSGGEIDKIPPEIIEVIPQNGTINFQNNSIEITFSEYVDKRSVQNSIFISPSIEGKIEYEWSGKTLEIIFPDKLKDNTTYTITIGTDVTDINNSNNMSKAFTLIFSTGNEIDNNSIKGKVFDKNPLGTYIFSYKINNDTLPDPSRIKPDYISQVGKEGDFEITGMSKGKYFILAVKDELRNLLYDSDEDAIGLPNDLYILGNLDTLITNVNFTLNLVDTIPPSILNVAMTDKNHFMLEFNERIDSSKISKNNFNIIDSTKNKIILLFSFFANRNKANQYFLTVSDTLSKESKNFLEEKNIYDIAGNIKIQESNEITLNDKPDTSAPLIKSINTQYGNNMVDYLNPYFELNFDDGINFDKKEKIFLIKEVKDSQNYFTVEIIDDAAIKIIYNNKLNSKSEYTLNFNTKYFKDAAGNSRDSNYVYKFTTNNELDFGGVSGIVVSKSKSKINLELNNINDKKTSYKQTLSKNNSFNFQRIKPGRYFLWGYEDKDSSNSYSKGNLKPFIYAEKFQYYPDTLNVRARWPIGDIKFEFDK